MKALIIEDGESVHTVFNLNQIIRIQIQHLPELEIDEGPYSIDIELSTGKSESFRFHSEDDREAAMEAIIEFIKNDEQQVMVFTF